MQHGEPICDASDRTAWLAARRTMLTASDVAPIMGLAPYAKRGEVLRAKVSGDSGPDIGALGGVAAVRSGQFKERGTFDWFIADHPGYTGDMVSSLYRSPSLTCLGATPDARLFPTVGPGQCVELKECGEKARPKWHAGLDVMPSQRAACKRLGISAVPEPLSVSAVGLDVHFSRYVSRLRHEDRDGNILPAPAYVFVPTWYKGRREWLLDTKECRAPLHYWVQLQVQMHVMGAEYGWVVGGIGGVTRYDIAYQRDARFEGIMLEIVDTFWKAVEAGRASEKAA